MKKRIEWVDITKGITILLVVFGHALQGIIDSSMITLDSANNSLLYVNDIIYGFHMPLFFFVSALFTGFLARSTKTVILQKVKRLLVPYFIWSFIVAVFMQMASRYTNSGLGIKDFFKSPVIPFSEYWFLYVLFFIYMLYLLVRIFFGDKTKKIILFLSILLLICKPIIPNIWIMNKISQNLFFFALGTYFFEFYKTEVKVGLKRLLITTIWFVIVNIVYVFLLHQNNSLILMYFWYLTAFTGIAWIISISVFISNLKLKKVDTFLNYCGNNSMQIYVMHLLPLAGVRIFLLKILGLTNLWIAVFITCFVSLVCCFIAIYILNHVHIGKYLFGNF